MQHIERTEAPSNRNSHPDWIAALSQRDSDVVAQAKTAVRLTPHPDCFLRGDDPLALIAALPDLLALDLQPLDTVPTLDTLDPFQSFLVMTALSALPAKEVKRLMQEHADVTEVIDLTREADRQDMELSVIARKMLEAQISLLESVQPTAFAGCVASAGRVAANVFRRNGRINTVEAVVQATEKSLAERNTFYLKNEIAVSLVAHNRATATIVSPAPSQSSPRSLRVDADRIDDFVRLAGELTVVKNAIGHAAKLATDSDNPLAAVLKTNHNSLDQITSELQRAALGMRVLPLSTVLQRFTRVVREMSANLRKPTNLVIEGGDTEADKAIVEVLFEPLLHIIRNAWIMESRSATRAARNKPEVATITITASRVGDRVDIEIRDDGSGIDTARVRAIAIERGIVTPESVDAMPEGISSTSICAGIFHSFYSDRAFGRGVGMDAVRTAVARMSGKVSIESSLNVGTTVRITLPFSILITQVMTVEAEAQMFGIPLEAIVETISVPVESIVGIGAARAVVRRNQTIPVFDLAALLHIGATKRNKSEALIVITSMRPVRWNEVDRLGEAHGSHLKPRRMLSGIPGSTGRQY